METPLSKVVKEANFHFSVFWHFDYYNHYKLVCNILNCLKILLQSKILTKVLSLPEVLGRIQSRNTHFCSGITSSLTLRF